MKKHFFLLLCALVCFTASFAQPLVSARISKGYNPYYSATDTIANTAKDTMYASISGTRHSVGFGINVAPVTGSADSFIVRIYGNKLINKSGPWTLLATLNAGYVDTLLDYNVNSGNGNPYTNYMLVLSSTNIVGCSASWQTWCLIR